MFGRISIKRVLRRIELADDFEIQLIMQSVEQRYAALFPDWEVIYAAVHKEPAQRAVDLQNILAVLKKEKTDSLC